MVKYLLKWDSTKIERIPYGRDKRFIEILWADMNNQEMDEIQIAMLEDMKAHDFVCPRCSAGWGEYHDLGNCYIEECPICRETLLDCDCIINNVYQTKLVCCDGWGNIVN